VVGCNQAYDEKHIDRLVYTSCMHDLDIAMV
jgi:hypothetical protein